MENLKEKFFARLREIGDKIENIHKELANKLNLNCGELLVLRILCIRDNLSVTEISKSCKLDKPATSRTLNKLIDDGFVDKSHQNDNKKTQYISLTQKGNVLKEKINEQLPLLREKYFNKISQKDLSTIINILDKVSIGEQHA